MAKLNWRDHKITTFNNTHSSGSTENRGHQQCENGHYFYSGKYKHAIINTSFCGYVCKGGGDEN